MCNDTNKLLDKKRVFVFFKPNTGDDDVIFRFAGNSRHNGPKLALPLAVDDSEGLPVLNCNGKEQ